MLRIDPVLAMSQALGAGVRFFQYRDKSSGRRDIYETSLKLALLARKEGALLIVNDHADIALAADADGVHLGQDDLPITYARGLLGSGKIIGISTHSAEQAKDAEAGGADYIGFGPVFRTVTKDTGPVQGIEKIPAIKRTVSVPVIAIGGITLENVERVISAGADGVAVIAAVLSASDSRSAAAEMVGKIQRSRKHRAGNQGE